jgi:hypothetical protein
MTWIGERAADDLHRVASRIREDDDWRREMLALADEKVHAGAPLDALTTSAPPSSSCCLAIPPSVLPRFLELIHRHYGDLAAHRHEVPYETGALPAYRFPASRPKGGGHLRRVRQLHRGHTEDRPTHPPRTCGSTGPATTTYAARVRSAIGFDISSGSPRPRCAKAMHDHQPVKRRPRARPRR